MIGFGYQQRTSGPLATPANLLRYARWAEELGYDAISVTDQVFMPVEVKSRYNFYETVSMQIYIEYE